VAVRRHPPWCWPAGAYLFSDRIALALTRARPADVEGDARLHNIVEGLCVAAGLPKPDLYVVDDHTLNAFSLGRNPGHASVVVTSGLLDKLNRVELEGVVAHELAHIRNHDTLVTTTAVGLPLLRVVLPGRRESVADATGVRFTRYPPGLIAALEKLRGEPSPGRSWTTAHLWINAPTPHRPATGRAPRPLGESAESGFSKIGVRGRGSFESSGLPNAPLRAYSGAVTRGQRPP
jgi:Zn-dependent protease with chaperone function